MRRECHTVLCILLLSSLLSRPNSHIISKCIFHYNVMDCIGDTISHGVDFVGFVHN